MHNLRYDDSSEEDMGPSTGNSNPQATPVVLPDEVRKAINQSANNINAIPQGTNNAWDAFCIIVANGPLAVLTKEDDEFSPAKSIKALLIEQAWPSRLAKLAIASLLGTAACVFFWKPGGKAALKIADIIHLNDVPVLGGILTESLKLAMQLVGAGENCTLTAYTTYLIMDDLTRREPNSDSRRSKSYLKYNDLTILNRLTLRLRGVFNHAASLAAISTIFYITYLNLSNVNAFVQWAVALLSAASNYGPYVAGTSGIKLTPSRMEPARKALLCFIKEQMNRFLRLNSETQAAMLANFKQYDAQDLLSNNIDMRQAIAMLFNIAAEASERQPDEELNAMIYKPKSSLITEILENLAGIVTAAGSAGYVKASYDSGGEISAAHPVVGVFPMAFSFLSTVGLGHRGGKNTANMVMTDDVNLARQYAPKLRLLIIILIILCGPFAGGTNFELNFDGMKALLGGLFNTLGIGSQYLNTIALASGIIGLTSASSVNSSFTIKMFDDILLYIANQTGDDELRRLIQYQAAMRDLYQVIETMTSENFYELLKEMLQDVDHDVEAAQPTSNGQPPPNLRKLILNILVSRLSPEQYEKLRKTEISRESRASRRTFADVLPEVDNDEAYGKPMEFRSEPSKLSSCCFFSNCSGLRRRRGYIFSEDNSSQTYGTNDKGTSLNDLRHT